MSFLGRLFSKLFGPRRQAQHLRYDTTLVPDEKGDHRLTERGKAQRKLVLTTELKEGDTYNLGPEAVVTVGPAGRAGKAWVTARVAASEKRRKEKFERWWEEKRAYCMRVMAMSEQELKDAGIYDEVQTFLAENRKMIAQVDSLKTAASPPSGISGERTAEAFGEILKVSGNARVEEMALVVDGRLADATPEAIERYRAASGYGKDE